VSRRGCEQAGPCTANQLRFSHLSKSWEWREYLGEGDFSLWIEVEPWLARSFFDEGCELVETLA
jgi:hypothetical protein